MAPNEVYREAERRIEEARRSGAKVLDLSSGRAKASRQLTELPESLGQLTQLQSLDLSGRQLTALPESLGQLTQLRAVDLSDNRLTVLPESMGQLAQLQSLDLSQNRLTALPESLSQLTQLWSLDLSDNRLKVLPESLGQLTQLRSLDLSKAINGPLPDWVGNLTNLENLDISANKLNCLPSTFSKLSRLKSLSLGWVEPGGNPLVELPEICRSLTMLEVLRAMKCSLKSLPDWLGDLANLKEIWLLENHLTDLPASLAQLDLLTSLRFDGNPVNPELTAAAEEGLDAVKRYLRAKTEAQVVLNEAKLILIGEGEVGKSCLLGALRDDPWEEGRPTTHGIEIKPVKVTDPDTEMEITLNGWDFGGQRVYRPTHQLFFSAPAVYLVVWKPREGPQQGFVKEWITLVKHRAPEAKILVVATHGGPKQRQPDIDRQEIWDLFKKDMVVDFFLVDSKPDKKTKKRKGIAELKQAIARVAASLPEMGRTVPRRWEQTRQALVKTGAAYLPLNQVLKLCQDQKMDEDEAKDFIRISHRLGHLILSIMSMIRCCRTSSHSSRIGCP